jgi:integrase
VAFERAVRAARREVDGLPEDYRFHDLRHYLASLLIASGLDVQVVQHRLRHGSAKTTLIRTATCGRTATIPHEQPWVRFWLLVRTQCGLPARPGVNPWSGAWETQMS